MRVTCTNPATGTRVTVDIDPEGDFADISDALYDGYAQAGVPAADIPDLADDRAINFAR